MMNLWVVNGAGQSKEARNDILGGSGGGVQEISSQLRGSWLGARIKRDGVLE